MPTTRCICAHPWWQHMTLPQLENPRTHTSSHHPISAFPRSVDTVRGDTLSRRNDSIQRNNDRSSARPRGRRRANYQDQTDRNVSSGSVTEFLAVLLPFKVSFISLIA